MVPPFWKLIMNEPVPGLQALLRRSVVLDTVSHYVYLGTLIGQDERYVYLEDADVHDLRDTNTTREVYVYESKRYGIKANRKRVMIRNDEVVSISALDDILE
jgi:hypothetical protein